MSLQYQRPYGKVNNIYPAVEGSEPQSIAAYCFWFQSRALPSRDSFCKRAASPLAKGESWRVVLALLMNARPQTGKGNVARLSRVHER